jgi:CheR methyltransferase, SAM binding domain
MFQAGIYNISQLSLYLDNPTRLANRPVAIDLYNQVGQLEPKKQGLAEETILNFAFSDGSYKKTHAQRFDSFDEKIIAYLEKNLDRNKNYKIHDLAVSDGRTSLDLFLKLEKIFPHLDFFASDKNIFVYIFPDTKNKSRRIAKDENGKILQITIPPFVLNLYSPKRAPRYKIKKAILYPINLILLRLLLVPLFRSLFIKTDETAGQKVILLQNKVLEMTKAKSNFHVNSFDMFQNNPEKFDLIRAMNVLNETYFSREEVTKIAANIISSLPEGGYFIAGSNKTAGTEVNGELMIKKDGQLQSLMKFGNGVQFRDILLSIKAA